MLHNHDAEERSMGVLGEGREGAYLIAAPRAAAKA